MTDRVLVNWLSKHTTTITRMETSINHNRTLLDPVFLNQFSLTDCADNNICLFNQLRKILGT